MDNIKEAYTNTDYEKEVSYLFDSQNPYFQNGLARLFKHEQSLIVGFCHPGQIYMGEPYCSFGYWQNGSEESSAIVFDEFESWAKQRGVAKMLGPINFSTIHDYRLPLETYVGMHWGEPEGTEEELEFLLNFGFEVTEKYKSHYIEDPAKIFNWGNKRSQRVLREESKLRRLDFKDLNFEAEKENLRNFLDQVFKENIGYIPVNDYEFQMMYSEEKIKHLSKFPSFFLKDKNNKFLGLFVSFLQENIFDKSKKENLLYFKTIGSVKNDEFSEAEVFFHLIHEIYQTYADLNKKYPICFTLMKEGNVPHKVALKFADISREYGLFAKTI